MPSGFRHWVKRNCRICGKEFETPAVCPERICDECTGWHRRDDEGDELDVIC